jgi:hypothetical protein
MPSPDPNWERVASLPGRRVTRVQVSRFAWEFRDDSATKLAGATTRLNRLGIAPVATGRLSGRRIVGEMRTADGDFRIVSRRFGIVQPQSELALEKLSDEGLITLMRSANVEGHHSVQTSATTPFGTVNEWNLPDGTRLSAFCLGKWKPYCVLSLHRALSPVIVVRFLPPPEGFLVKHLGTGQFKRFRVGEAVLSSGLPGTSDLLPLLFFSFQVLQAINMPRPPEP